MKTASRIFRLSLCLFLFVTGSGASPVAADTTPSAMEQSFQEGNEAYRNGDYGGAIQFYLRALEEAQSAALHYNLGNAFFRVEQYGPAILHYEKALALDPGNPEVRANLALARERVNISTGGDGWLRSLGSLLTVTTWAWVAALSFWVCVFFLLAARYTGIRLLYKRLGLVLGLLVLALSTAALLHWHERASQGIVVTEEAPLKLSPTSTAPVNAYLEPGASARILKSFGNYYHVRDQRNRTGWLNKQDFIPVWQQ